MKKEFKYIERKRGASMQERKYLHIVETKVFTSRSKVIYIWK